MIELHPTTFELRAMHLLWQMEQMTKRQKIKHLAAEIKKLEAPTPTHEPTEEKP